MKLVVDGLIVCTYYVCVSVPASAVVFVLTFKGDMQASQVSRLREEITALLNIADPVRGDHVVVQLDSRGGTVTGYGLGAAQLMRIKDARLPLTICIDEFAASGGYMMASVADNIIASPFAVIGSVGVISIAPNFSERLEREGISFDAITAGKYKQTLAPYKKSTYADRAKVKSDTEAILTLFKDFLKENRPKLNVNQIATGETWQGPMALKLGLIDGLQTSDDFLLSCRNQGADVLKISLVPAKQMRGLPYSAENSMLEWVQDSCADFISGIIYKTFVKTTPQQYPGNHEPFLVDSTDDFSAFNHQILAMDSNKYPPMF